MSAAPVLMTAQPGGAVKPTHAPLTVTKTARDLHIDYRILAQPGLSLTACALLAEVLDLYQVKGQVFANDAHFAARCRCGERTVRSTIAELEEGGYLERDVNAKRSTKRMLVPTDKWQILPEVVAEFAMSAPEVPANSAGSRGKNCQESWQNLPKVPAKIANINTNLNTKGNTNSNTAAGAVSEGAENLDELALLAGSPDAAPHTEGGATDVATSKVKPPGPRGWAYDPAAIAENLRLPFASAEFRAAWVKYRTYREEMGFRRLSGGLMEQQQLDSLAQLAAGSEAHALLLIEQAIGAGWQKFYPLDKNYATARQSAPKRPAGNGRVETLPPTTYGRNRGGQPPAAPASPAA